MKLPLGHNLIFAPWNSGLGDQWATVNLLAHRSASTGIPARLHSDGDLRPLHSEIVQALDCGVGRVHLTVEPPTAALEGYDVWATPYYPTKIRWHASGRHPYVCYQLDGLSAASDKNPPLLDECTLLAALATSGFEPVRLGKHLSILDCVTLAAQSAFFVGVDSGMSHLCHSVGVPMFLLEYKLPVVTCHRGKAYIHCQGTEDFLRHKLPTWVDYQRFILSPDHTLFTVPVGRDYRTFLEKNGESWWLPSLAQRGAK